MAMDPRDIELEKVVKIIEVDGFTVYIGRSAAMNDILTTRIARPNDLWFHASGVPGAHVVIRIDNEQPSKETIKTVARMTAQNSKGKGKINVVYTEAKHVKKARGLNVGQVIITNSRAKTIKVFSNN